MSEIKEKCNAELKLSEIKKKWKAECKEEGGRWYSNNPEEFEEKRAVLMDATGFKSTAKVSILIIILSFVIPLIVVPLIMFRGAWDYLIIAVACVLVSFACNAVWKLSVKEYGLKESEDHEGGGKR